MNHPYTEQNIVEAIEEGKIVRVSEVYAKREGLPILRKSRPGAPQEKATSSPETKKIIQKEFRDERSKRMLDYLRKPTGWQEKQVISELIPNFSWHISKARRNKSLTRKQLAKLVNTDEDSIKLLENGLLPNPDFILINKIQIALNINLRKDKQDFTKEMTLDRMKNQAQKQEDAPKKAEVDHENILGEDIEIIDDE